MHEYHLNKEEKKVTDEEAQPFQGSSDSDKMTMMTIWDNSSHVLSPCSLSILREIPRPAQTRPQGVRSKTPLNICHHIATSRCFI